MSKKAKRRGSRQVWVVGVEYTVRGTVVVEAETEAEAREAAHDEMSCPPTCEIPDWTTTSARVEE
jgi:hypothetical protein